MVIPIAADHALAVDSVEARLGSHLVPKVEWNRCR